MSGRTSYLGARHEERRISPSGSRMTTSRRADEERRIFRAGEERRISLGGSRTMHLAARTEIDGSRAYFFLEGLWSVDEQWYKLAWMVTCILFKSYALLTIALYCNISATN